MKMIFVILAITNLALAILITLGGGFSSYAFAAQMALLVDLPIIASLSVMYFSMRWSAILMSAGLVMLLLYLISQSYYRIRNGDGVLPFQVAWAALAVALLILSISHLKLSFTRRDHTTV